jgi:hypothetical protein
MRYSSQEKGGFGIRFVRNDGTSFINTFSCGWIVTYDTIDAAEEDARAVLSGEEGAYMATMYKTFEIVPVQKGQRVMTADQAHICALRAALFQARATIEAMKEREALMTRMTRKTRWS